jgi:ribosomal RNA-processing protein 36
MEMSSTRAVGRHIEVIAPAKKVSRDPRFETLSGNLDDAVFRKTHAFLFNENLPAEKKKLQLKLKVSLKRVHTHR